jgi:hypothetical protein
MPLKILSSNVKLDTVMLEMVMYTAMTYGIGALRNKPHPHGGIRQEQETPLS